VKVLLVTWACDLDDVSEPFVAATWARQLAGEHEVTLFSVSRPDRFGCVQAQFPDLEVFEWVDVAVPGSLERFRAVVNPGYFRYVRKARRFIKYLLTKREFDVIHHLSPFSWRYPSPATDLGVPLVRGPVAGGLQTPAGLKEALPQGPAWMRLRGVDQARLRWDPRLRHNIRDVDHLLLAAPYVQDILAQVGDLPPSSVESEWGLEPQDLPAVRTRGPGQPPIFLYSGRIIPSKGLRFALRGLAAAQSRDARLRVVGDGDDRPGCERLVAELGLSDRVSFDGWVSPAEVRRAYEASDVLLFPSVREPSGGVVLEAMSHSMPVITAAAGGPAAMVSDDCGFRVTTASPDATIREIAAAIDLLVSDPELISRMGARGRERAEQLFAWPAKLQRVNDIYRAVAQA